MSHYTTCAIFPSAGEKAQEKFNDLYKTEEGRASLADMFSRKLEKPLNKFDINQNSDGHFDGWGVYDVMPMKELLNNLDGMVPQAFLLPDLKWIESETWFYFVSEENKNEYDKWIDKIKEIGLKYPNSVAVLIDCHI